MAWENRRAVFAYLLRRQDPKKLLLFFQVLSEALTTAFSDAQQLFPADPTDRSAVFARGSARRMYIHRAVLLAATQSGLLARTRYTVPPTWHYPVVRIGAFSITAGIVDRQYVEAPRRLRNRGKYVRELAERNQALDPQSSLFQTQTPSIKRVIPDGTFGAMVVVEPSLRSPDAPMYIGFWIPSPNLRKVYYRCSLETLIRHLQAEIAAVQTPTRAGVKRRVPKLRPERKKPK